MSVTTRLRITLEMIKIEHTLFALPFALLGATLAARALGPRPASFWAGKLVWITLAMVGARSAAMAFDRVVCHSGLEAEHSGPDLISRSAGLGPALFLHQAIYGGIAPVSWLVPGDCTGRRLDRHTGQARRCSAVAFTLRDAMDGGVRHPVFVPGF